jgi:hypothetical protein
MMRWQWSIREMLLVVAVAGSVSWCARAGWEQYLEYRYPYRIVSTDTDGRPHLERADWARWYADYRRTRGGLPAQQPRSPAPLPRR